MQPLEFSTFGFLEKPFIYSLIDLNNNQRRLKAVLTKEEYENKIPKIIQKFYKKVPTNPTDIIK